ncbi:hypothetical protein D3C77_640270 [compost metagenome]
MAQAQAAAQALTDFGGQAAGLLQLAQQVAGPRQKRQARCGQARLAGGAFEQRGGQLTLQLLYLPAQRRLRDEQALGGSTETAGLGNLDEVA